MKYKTQFWKNYFVEDLMSSCKTRFKIISTIIHNVFLILESEAFHELSTHQPLSQEHKSYTSNNITLTLA